MNFVYGFLLAFGCVCIAAEQPLKCTLTVPEIPKGWLDMVDPCIRVMEAQVKTEITAAITYLAMGAHFARDSINRPGFSKFFLASASEEREHALKIIEYLLMRGQLTTDVSKLLEFPLKPEREVWTDGVTALREALKLETHVTSEIRTIIKVCEEPSKDGTNDYHLADYLTGDFLEEQYRGQRDLAGKISTLGKMMVAHGPLGEFLFDKKLLNGEL